MATDQLIRSINPATEDVLAEFQAATPQQIEETLGRAEATYHSWRKTGFGERAALMHRAAATLRAQKARWAGIITAEMGKPIVEAEAEVEKCAWNCEFYAENAARFLRRSAGPNRPRELCAVHAARHRAGDHAVELPLLAGVPLRGAGADGRERRRSSSTPPTCPRARWRSKRSSAEAGFPAGALRRCSSPARGRRAHRRPARRARSHSPAVSRPAARWRPRPAGDQEDGAGAGRLRPVHRARRRRPRRSGRPSASARASRTPARAASRPSASSSSRRSLSRTNSASSRRHGDCGSAIRCSARPRLVRWRAAICVMTWSGKYSAR